MGFGASKEHLITTAIENQDSGELRILMKDMTPEQMRAVCNALVPGDENQCTVLHYATWQDNPDILAPLLEYANDLEVRDGLGWTPLMTAVNRGSKQNVKMLLDRGAKIDCDWTKGMSLIADAMTFNDIDLVALLIEHGAQVTPSEDMLVDGQDQTGVHLLHFAVDDGLIDMARLLIEKGKVPLNKLDQAGWSPLHLAAGHNFVEIAKILLEKGADPNIRDNDGNTPLAWARKMRAEDTMKLLANSGAIADTDWHGEPLKLKSHEEHEKDWKTAIEESENIDQEQQEKEKTTNGIEKSQFEIEIDQPTSKRKTSLNSKESTSFDALQRHRTVDKSFI